MKRFQGVLPALLTPMDDQGRILFPELERLIDWLFEKGVHGLYVGGTSGEGLLLDLEERQEVTERVIAATKKRGPIVVHVGAVATSESIELAQHAEKSGADAIAAIPPFAFGRNLAGIRAHYSALAHGCSLPLFLYNIPSLTAVNLRADDIKSLLDLPTVCGLKFSDYDLFEEFRIIELNRSLEVLHGCDETLLYALMMGASGGVGLTYNLFPELIRSIYESHGAGRFAHANVLQLHLSRFISELIRSSGGNIVGMVKKLMEVRGFRCGAARPPNPSLPAEGVERMIAEVRRLDKELKTLADR